MKKGAVIFFGFLVFSVFFGLDQRKPGSPASPVPLAGDPKTAQAIGSSSLKVDRDFGKMPVYFIPNRGQMDERVAFYVQGKDKTIYFTPQGLTITLAGSKPDAPSLTSPLSQGSSPIFGG